MLLVAPNILRMFNDAKNKSFMVLSQEIYNEAEKKYLQDSANRNEQSCYGKLDSYSSISNIPDEYWTSTPATSPDSFAYFVNSYGGFDSNSVANSTSDGIRPVITVLKDDMD